MDRQFRCGRCDSLHSGTFHTPGCLSFVCATCVPVASAAAASATKGTAPSDARTAPRKRKVRT